MTDVLRGHDLGGKLIWMPGDNLVWKRAVALWQWWSDSLQTNMEANLSLLESLDLLETGLCVVSTTRPPSASVACVASLDQVELITCMHQHGCSVALHKAISLLRQACCSVWLCFKLWWPHLHAAAQCLKIQNSAAILVHCRRKFNLHYN